MNASYGSGLGLVPHFLGLLVGCCFVTGCDRSNKTTLYPVTGKVLVNGNPAPNAMVVFHPVGAASADGIKPRAQVKADGTFELTSLTAGDGAPAGNYAVTVEWWLSPSSKRPDADPSPVNQLPTKYAKPESSGLTATIGSGPTEVPTFSLKK